MYLTNAKGGGMPQTYREHAPRVPVPPPTFGYGSMTERANPPPLESIAENKGYNAISGYSGFHQGMRQVFGKGYSNSIKDAAVTKLPQLTTSNSLPPSFYYRKSTKRGEVRTPNSLRRNRSAVTFGDDRHLHWDSQTTNDFQDWGEQVEEEELPREEIAKRYVHAKKRVPEWRVDQMERDMKAKIAQKARGGAFTLRRAFKFFDRDGSGGLSFEEFQQGMDLMGLQFTDEEVLALMARNDPECTNDIDYMRLVETIQQGDWFAKKFDGLSEAVENSVSDHVRQAHGGSNSRLKRPSPALYKEMQKVFKKVDASKNGALSPEEVKFFVRKLGIQLDEDKIARLFVKMTGSHPGKEGKGFITFDQFYEWYKTYAYDSYGLPKGRK